MNLKIIAIILGVVAVLGIGYAVYTKIVQPSESQKAKEIVNYNYTVEPHFGGCARMTILPNK